MPAIITKGAFSAQGYGFGASAATGATYIEDVFSTYLYTGNGTSQTITNNIDLSTKGGMVWIKGRNAAYDNYVNDTARGAGNILITNDITASVSFPTRFTGFTTSGFSVGGASNPNATNDLFVSWTFRKQPKFFDVVTYTGTGSARTIAHNLGSAPGMIIVKRTDATSNWAVYHNSLTSASYYLMLNNTTGQTSDTTVWNGTAPTSSVFSVGTSTMTNANGGTYVAYLYAHNAGGFGAAGTDNVISCGSFSGGNQTVTLGYEPQYIFVKTADSPAGEVNWYVMDNMRGLSMTQGISLNPNLPNAEVNYWGGVFVPTATGFNVVGSITAGTYIYMAIRRGPMKTPTDATKVFSPIVSNSAQGTQLTTGFPVDAQLLFYRTGSISPEFFDRLRGISTTSTSSGVAVATASTAAEISRTETQNWGNTGFQTSSGWASSSMVYENFRRAPGFFDEVCYTGTGAVRTVAHNLGVAPQLLIVKSRSYTWSWQVWYTGLTSSGELNSSAAFSSANTAGFFGNNTTTVQPTSSVFTLGSYSGTNQNNTTYLTYLFATLSGVSKVGTYTGTGAAQNIDCGFAASARFILIKRTDSTGDWYLYDSARGISASNDPYLLLNSTAAEVTNTDYVGTYASGFALTSTAPAGLNANGGSFIFLAVA